MSAHGMRKHWKRRSGPALPGPGEEGDLAGLGQLALLPPLVLHDILKRVDRDTRTAPQFIFTCDQENSSEFFELATLSKAFRTAINNSVTVFVAKVEFGDFWGRPAAPPEDPPAPACRRRWPTLAALQLRLLALHRLQTLSHWPALSTLILWLHTPTQPGPLAVAVRAIGQGCPMLRTLTLYCYKTRQASDPGSAVQPLDLTPLLPCRHLNSLEPKEDLGVVPSGASMLSSLRTLTWIEEHVTPMDVPDLPSGLEELDLFRATLSYYPLDARSNDLARVPLHLASGALITGLKTLRLSQMELQGDVQLPPSLECLSLTDTVVKGGGRFTGSFPRLTDLTVYGKHDLRRSCVQGLLSAVSLTSVYLSGVLTDTGHVMLDYPPELSRCTNLRSLVLENCSMGFVDPSPELILSPFQLLESLCIKAWWTWGPTGVFRDLPKLRELRLLCFGLSVVYLVRLPSLRILEFPKNSTLERVEGFEEISPQLDEEILRRCRMLSVAARLYE